MIRSRAIVLCFGAALAASAAADVTLRIVTFNTYQGIANSAPDRAAAGKLLTSLDLDGAGPNTSLMPDVVCLQETTSLSALNSFRNEFLPGYQVIKGTFTDGFFSNGFFIRGDLTILDLEELSTGGPRRVLRLILEVPGAADPLVVYNAHFKAGSEPGDIATRAAEANAMANRVAADLNAGIDTNDDRVPDVFLVNYLFAGDLNHNDFAGTAIDPLLVGGTSGQPTGLNDVRLESIFGFPFSAYFGNTFSTRTSLGSRYDYILASDAIYAALDGDASGTVTQDELNAAGMVYISSHDGGLHASGQADATTQASDHAPVRLAVTLSSGAGVPGDVDGDGDVDLTDLGLMLQAYGTTLGNPGYNSDADFDGNGVIDLADLAVVLQFYGTP